MGKIRTSKSIDDTDCSRIGFIKFVQSCISRKSEISENYILALRDLVISEAKIFKKRSIKDTIDDSIEHFIISTKQSLLSYAVEEKLIHSFKRDIDEIKSKFILLIPCKSNLPESFKHRLGISENERTAILIYMLMCYAKLVKKIIFEEKMKYLKVFFVEFGHIYITKIMSNKLHSVIKKLPEIVPAILASKHLLIKEEVEKKGFLSESSIRNIVVNFAESKEIKTLKKTAEEAISESCHKILVNKDQLIPKSDVVLKYVKNVFFYNLEKSLEDCIKSNISSLLSEILTKIPTQYPPLVYLNKEFTIIPSEKIAIESTHMVEDIGNDKLQTTADDTTRLSKPDPESPSYEAYSSSSISQLMRKRSHTPPGHYYPEERKKFRSKLFSRLAKKCEHTETVGNYVPNLDRFQLTSELPPNAASELLESIRKIETDLTYSSVKQQEHSTIRLHPAKSMGDIEYSPRNFISFIKSLIGEEVPIGDRILSKLRKEIALEAKEFELTFIKIASNEKKSDDFIRETKQRYLANAIEEKLIDIFKSTIVAAKEKFSISLQELQEKLCRNRRLNLGNSKKLETFKKNHNAIVVHMLMCYAGMVNKLICDNKVLFSDLEKFFVKIGQVYVTKHVYQQFEGVKSEFRENIANAIETKSELMEESTRTTDIVANNIIGECVGDNESRLEERVKSVLSKHCSKVAVNNDQLINSSPLVEEYLIKELLISLKE
ncbi:hypothetical protein [Candidatus Ichthyocystis hellenicum]|uniref:hypothetical protein n=1 Tax=Candidatus Ichthyocystis hellenicum TaxID=1561003 RepID=UPI00111262E3|nr:hypothetical protein [Candidatus Ichthyocystis hellenicum]